MPEGAGHSWAEERMSREVESLLAQAPSYRSLDPRTRRTLAESLAAVTRALTAGTPADIALANVADLRSRMVGGAGDSGSADSGASASSSAPADSGSGGSPASPAPASGTPASTGPASRVGDVARATLNAIDFPAFVAGLLSGTFHPIVDGSTQQLEAYAE